MSLLHDLKSDIESHRSRVALQPDRAQRVAALEFLLKQFGDLATWLDKNPTSAKAVMLDGFLPLLGLMLSAQGLERLLGPVGLSVDERLLEDVVHRRWPYNGVTFDTLTQVQRQSVAVQVGPPLFGKLLAAMRQPLERALQMEKQHKGGRPQNIERNHVVGVLAAAWQAEHGTHAPTGKTGPFFDQCHEMLVALKLNTDGLAECIRRTVQRQKVELDRARQNPG